jgi:hypothetical protein
VFADKDGVDWSNDTGSPDGLPYKLTTVGREYFAPGDVFVSTLDNEVQRVYKRADFDPFFKEVEEVESAESIQEGIAGDGADDGNGTGYGSSVHRESDSTDGTRSIRVSDAETETMGRAKVPRGHKSAQHGNSDHQRNESRSNSKLKESRKTRVRHISRKTGRRNLKNDVE